MSIKLREASPSDAPTIIDIYFDAFRDHPATLRGFPPSSAHTQAYWQKSINAELLDPNAHFILAIDSFTPHAERVVGFGKWVEPRTATSPPPPPPVSLPEDGDIAFLEDFLGTLDKKHGGIMTDRPHWCLELLGVRDAYQGKGVGRQLLQWGLDRADEAHLEAYLSASRAGAFLYTKCGFETMETAIFDNGKYLETFMVRQPKKGS